jgi:hypothetical protein
MRSANKVLSSTYSGSTQETLFISARGFISTILILSEPILAYDCFFNVSGDANYEC